jgi:hypothetical protein
MKINLTSGDSQPRSVLASCQRRLNVYAEAIDPKTGEPVQLIHYPTPGLRKITAMPNGKPARCLYRASNGDLYAVSDFDVYYIDPKLNFKKIGSFLSTDTLHPIKMTDNGVDLIFCDGTPVNGYAINLKSRSELKPLFNPAASDDLTDSSTGWLGSTHVDFSDGFFIANFIGTPSFYISNAQNTIFDALQFAGKTSYPDSIVAAIVQHRVIWLLGEVSSEVWYNTGGGSTPGNNFPFELMPGVAIDYGCKAPYSIAKAETSIFFLGQTQYGLPVVLRGHGYSVSRVSTHPLEHILSGYADVSDCIAYTYMVEGHSFYVMNFPSANATWTLDLSTDQWHQRAWIDIDGEEHRHRGQHHAFAYGMNIVSDWQNGNLYELDTNSFTDDGNPIKRVVGFPRQIDLENAHRVLFRNFIAEFDVGESRVPNDNPLVILSWSDDKGKTWSNGLHQPIGKMGNFNHVMNWHRLGLSRNRVFRLEWQCNAMTALVGAFVEVGKANS